MDILFILYMIVKQCLIVNLVSAVAVAEPQTVCVIALYHHMFHFDILVYRRNIQLFCYFIFQSIFLTGMKMNEWINKQINKYHHYVSFILDPCKMLALQHQWLSDLKHRLKSTVHPPFWDRSLFRLRVSEHIFLSSNQICLVRNE